LKPLSNSLRWPDLNKENIDLLYQYCITKDDDNTEPVPAEDFLADRACAFADPEQGALEDYFYGPKFMEAGVSLRFLFGQLKCVHDGIIKVPLSSLRILKDSSEWCSEQDSLYLEKLAAMAVQAHLMPKIDSDGICDLSNPAIQPR